ncbi:MAG: type II toxin-antitoxin system Phd/YefM family antitoxin, partial [Actinobacteria bacterium]|nr:type II toxin-antitoxin system Phd/YefM family antitoxin [Actinomycetota bacterium]
MGRGDCHHLTEASTAAHAPSLERYTGPPTAQVSGAGSLLEPHTPLEQDSQHDYPEYREVVAVPEATHDQTWSVADAKARLSELLEHVINDGPQAIT